MGNLTEQKILIENYILDHQPSPVTRRRDQVLGYIKDLLLLYQDVFPPEHFQQLITELADIFDPNTTIQRTHSIYTEPQYRNSFPDKIVSSPLLSNYPVVKTTIGYEHNRAKTPQMEKLVKEIIQDGGITFSQSLASAFPLWKTQIALENGDIRLPKRAVVLELCGAPGNKSFNFFELLDQSLDELTIIINDIHPGRVQRIKDRLLDFGFLVLDDNLNHFTHPNKPLTVFTTCIDATKTSELREIVQTYTKGERNAVDLVIADVHCKGSGVALPQPEKMSVTGKPKAVNKNELRAQLLHSGLSLIENSGKVIFSTCSIHPQENSDVIALFSDEVEEVSPLKPDGAIFFQDKGSSKSYGTLLSPQNMDTGFFTAILQRSRY